MLIGVECRDGQILWKKDYVKDYGADLGHGLRLSAARRVVDGDRLIALIGGPPDAKVVAFDKKTGEGDVAGSDR